MLRKLKWQIAGLLLAARYNWCQGPVPGRGPAIEKHWLKELKNWQDRAVSATSELTRRLDPLRFGFTFLTHISNNVPLLLPSDYLGSVSCVTGASCLSRCCIAYILVVCDLVTRVEVVGKSRSRCHKITGTLLPTSARWTP